MTNRRRNKLVGFLLLCYHHGFDDELALRLVASGENLTVPLRNLDRPQKGHIAKLGTNPKQHMAQQDPLSVPSVGKSASPATLWNDWTLQGNGCLPTIANERRKRYGVMGLTLDYVF